jgi:hypothetical protein
MLVNTVRDNFEGYTKYDIAMAKEARQLQGMIWNPIKRIVHEQFLSIRPITVRHIDNANHPKAGSSLCQLCENPKGFHRDAQICDTYGRYIVRQ